MSYLGTLITEQKKEEQNPTQLNLWMRTIRCTMVEEQIHDLKFLMFNRWYWVRVGWFGRLKLWVQHQIPEDSGNPYVIDRWKFIWTKVDPYSKEAEDIYRALLTIKENQ